MPDPGMSMEPQTCPDLKRHPRSPTDCPDSFAPEILVLGLGNDLLCDDAVGLRLARALRERLAGLPDVEVAECSEMGLALLDHMVGFKTLVLIDAVQSGRAPAGVLHEFRDSDLPAVPTKAPHFLGVGEVIALGRKLGLAVPERTMILGIEAADTWSVRSEMTPPLEAALAGLAARIEDQVLRLRCR